MNLLEAVPHNSEQVLLSRIKVNPNDAVPTKTILLAEDDTDLRLVTTYILNTMGYRVIACYDGISALTSFIRTPDIDLLLTDYELTGMTGLQLARELTERQPSLPVLFVTGTLLTTAIVKELIARGWGHMSKPSDTDALRRTLHRLLSRNERIINLEAS